MNARTELLVAFNDLLNALIVDVQNNRDYGRNSRMLVSMYLDAEERNDEDAPTRALFVSK